MNEEQKKLLQQFAEQNKGWPKEALDFALWKVKWALTALPHQREPEDGDYDTFLLLAGRGSGKTHTASNWLGLRAAEFDHTRWLVTAPTSNDIRATCFEGDSGLLNIIPESLIKDYNKSLFELTLKNGSIIRGIPASEPERFRGTQWHGMWADELCAFEYIDDAYDQIQFTLRLTDPRIKRVQSIITTTPKPLELIVDLNEGKVGGDVYVSRASSYDNRKNLSPTFFKQLEAYEGTDSVILSTKSNYMGRNLQDRWHKNLIVGPPGKADTQEQLIGRTHRTGQKSDIVEVSYFLGSVESAESVDRARARAEIDKRLGRNHASKLLLCDWLVPDIEGLIKARNNPRWRKT